MQKVIVIHAPLRPGATAPWYDMLQSVLPYAKRLELDRLPPPVRGASLAGLGLALAAAFRATGAALSPGELAFPAGGKPYFRSGPWFSVSHSAARVACAASVVVEVGLDCEEIPAGCGPAAAEKLARWTATEAALKAAGLGLRQVHHVLLDSDLQSAEVTESRYVLRLLPLAPTAVCHLATRVPVDVSIEQVVLDAAEVSALVERSLRLPPQRD
jgi:phosphopantetheinyl transferase